MVVKFLNIWAVFLFLMSSVFNSIFNVETLQENKCITILESVPIPKKGETISICLQDNAAPEKAFVYEANIKVGLEGVDAEDFEYRITRADSKTDQIFLPESDLKNEVIYFSDIHLFDGYPAQGTWIITIKNVSSRDTGLITGVSLMAYYSKDGKEPENINGAGNPTILQMEGNLIRVTPFETVESKSVESLQPETMLMSTFDVNIMNENFELVFPPSGTLWSVYDLYPATYGEIYWDDDDYRSYDGYWSAWPAKGGPDGCDPPYYLPYMNSWMVYGPFSLSEAKSAEFNFMLYRSILDDYDNSYLGEDQVWIAWKFYSDYIMESNGPWVDNINLTFEPDQVTVQGNFSYEDRFGVTVPGREIKVQLYDEDGLGVDDLLAETYTDANGNYAFPAISNWDIDENQLQDPEFSRLDLYVKWRLGNNYYKVETVNGDTYGWYSATRDNIQNGSVSVNATIDHNAVNQKALWIYDDIRKTRNYYKTYTYPSSEPGFLSARWSDGVNVHLPCTGSCFLAIDPSAPYAFIGESSVLSADIVVHELAHHIMFNKTNQWLWNEFSCYEHYIFQSELTQCAWSEGWADFLPLLVNNDVCLDFGIGPCFGAANYDFYDIENHNWNDNPLYFEWGDDVEGRVAGALYDLVDSNNEDPFYDTADWSLGSIVDIALVGDGIESFSEYWDGYQGWDKHNGVKSIYQNTINYNNPPTLSIADRHVLGGIVYTHAIDLWDLANDEESKDEQLEFRIVNSLDYHCGISLESNRWININPVSSWNGTCAVYIEASDSIDTDSEWFSVTVSEVASRTYLPLLVKD
jgi:hypothetical protein